VDEEDDDRSARPPEPDDAVRICRALNESGARYASPATLIRTKDTPRPQDAIDRAFLEGVLRERASRREKK